MLNEEDFLFGKCTLEMNLISKAELENCILIYQAYQENGVKKSLEKVMMENDHITKANIKEIYRLLGRNRMGKYEILEKVAQGSTAAVYRATNLENQETVALKILFKELEHDKEFVQRFLREAKALSVLQHPNIVHAQDVGEARDSHFLAMEFVKGGPLSDILKEQGHLDERFCLEISFQIADALKYIHAKKFIHRDIKPENIMVTPQATVKLMDLGLSKRVGDTSITKRWAIMGTPYYISPEQARGEKNVDQRADIYSLGATMYHLLTGRPPFDGESPGEVLDKHLTATLTPLRDVQPKVSEKAAKVVEKMLEKDRKKRYQNFDQVLNTIHKLLRPDLSVSTEKLEDKVDINPELVYSEEEKEKEKELAEQAELAFVPPILKRNKGKKISTRIKKTVQKTRWEVIVLLVLFAIVLTGSIVLYSILRNAPKIIDTASYQEQIDGYASKWQLKKLSQTLSELYKEGGNNVDEVVLLEMMNTLEANYKARVQGLLEGYMAVDDLTILNGREVLICLENFKVFGLPEVVEKYKQLHFMVTKDLKVLEQRLEKQYYPLLDEQLAARKYDEARESLEKYLANLVVSEDIKKRILATREKIDFARKQVEKFTAFLEKHTQTNPDKLLGLYFKNGNYLRGPLAFTQNKKVRFSYFQGRKFEVNSNGKPVRQGPIDSFIVNTSQYSAKEFFRELHTISLLSILGDNDDYNIKLRFLLLEKRDVDRDRLVKLYLERAQQEAATLTPQVLAQAKDVINSRLNFGARSLFEQASNYLFRFDLEESQKFRKKIVGEFARAPWYRQNQSELNAFDSHFTTIKLVKQKEWSLAGKKLSQMKNRYGESDFLSTNSEEIEALRLWLASHEFKHHHGYDKSMNALKTLVEKHGNSKFYQSHKEKLALEQGFVSILADLSSHGEKQEKTEVINQVKDHLQKVFSEKDLAGELECLVLLAREYHLVPRTKGEKIPERIKSLETINTNFPRTQTLQVYRDDFQALRLYSQARQSKARGDYKTNQVKISLLQRLYPQSSFHLSYLSQIRADQLLRGQTFPHEKNKLKLVYDFNRPGVLQDWNTQGWGVFQNQLTFLNTPPESWEREPFVLKSKLGQLDSVEFDLNLKYEFAFLINIGFQNFLFYPYDSKIYFTKEKSIESYIIRGQRGELSMLGGRSVLPDWLEGGECVIGLKLTSPTQVMIHRQPNVHKTINLDIEYNQQVFTLWLRPGSGIKSITFYGRLEAK